MFSLAFYFVWELTKEANFARKLSEFVVWRMRLLVKKNCDPFSYVFWFWSFSTSRSSETSNTNGSEWSVWVLGTWTAWSFGPKCQLSREGDDLTGTFGKRWKQKIRETGTRRHENCCSFRRTRKRTRVRGLGETNETKRVKQFLRLVSSTFRRDQKVR